MKLSQRFDRTVDAIKRLLDEWEHLKKMNKILEQENKRLKKMVGIDLKKK
jgi:cell shape-determining protein MreC